jgi:hypothetical protein
MTIDPYSIPPPRGWSPPVNPDQQIIPPPIGSTPVGQPLPPPIGSTPVGQPLPPPRGWSPAIEPSQQVSTFTPNYSNSFTNPYPIQPPIGALHQYTVSPPRGWTPSVAPDPNLLPPPKALPASEGY